MPLIAVAALPCGLVIGLLLGALGGGGSILAVPALVYLLHQSPHEATAGALVVVGIGAASGLAFHARAGRVRWAAGAAFGGLGTAGTFLGSRWSASLDPTVLMTAFAGMMLAVAAAMLVQTRRERKGTRGRAKTPGREKTRAVRDRPHAVRTAPTPATTGTLATSASPTSPATATTRLASALRIGATATAVGLLTGFFGVGGGFVVVPALTLVLGLEMPVAVGTSLLVILINSATAFATRAGAGGLDWPLLATLAACAALGSWLGNRLAARVRPQALSTAFASLVTVLAVSVAVTSIPRL
ncbi:sulfite exporter TauE/SafE family protein [Streptomyces sp. NPDC059788]|uniref:sulfite exporter TauE/SafE family protein n=1 Tax=Streptomyces sp. NPDC059788 TaxID=3346948 RepID=UPI0036692817